MPINYKDHLKFKIPAGKKFVTKIITEQNQAGITYQCNMVFSFVPKPKTEYQAEIYMDKNKTDCNLVVSETTKDGQQLVTVKGEKLSQSWDRKLMGDPTFVVLNKFYSGKSLKLLLNASSQ
ncbi:MAG: hypothetical protein HWD59_05885 [Coxiellaceae bacterium]|nr:MAG: hypothetical protein HWD59_05885 [Coxiellaceae bacterium]